MNAATKRSAATSDVLLLLCFFLAFAFGTCITLRCIQYLRYKCRLNHNQIEGAGVLAATLAPDDVESSAREHGTHHPLKADLVDKLRELAVQRCLKDFSLVIPREKEKTMVTGYDEVDSNKHSVGSEERSATSTSVSLSSSDYDDFEEASVDVPIAGESGAASERPILGHEERDVELGTPVEPLVGDEFSKTTISLPFPGQKADTLDQSNDLEKSPSTTITNNENTKNNTRNIQPSSPCVICLENYQPSEKICWSSNPECCHIFHETCITATFVSMGRVKVSCPHVYRDTPLEKILDFDLECPCCRREFVTREAMLEASVDDSDNGEGGCSGV